ncbi:MAG: hypothetical protein JRI70_03655 [Deltaproteobacteria bacterium]|nr:hypothetical protein [Deltaproteobacteria bacterium]MBW2171737.1 hypothetical protein [Deltaproteobacteria bacterium]
MVLASLLLFFSHNGLLQGLLAILLGYYFEHDNADGTPSNKFLTLLSISLFSDSIDRLVARKPEEASGFGGKLGSWRDLATYQMFSLCASWLFWPEILKTLT